MNPRTLFASAALLTLGACSTAGLDAPFGLRHLSSLDGDVSTQPSTVTPVAGLPAPATPDSATAMPAASPAPVAAAPSPEPTPALAPPRWRKGGVLMQGLFGATEYTTVERTGGGLPPVDGSDDDLSQVPMLGGGAQWKLGGDGIDFGFEGLLAFQWRSDAAAVAVGSGGALVAVDVDLFVFDLYGGPFASVFLGDSLRLFASAGPLMQWGQYEESSVFDDGSSSGFGLGYYARTGLEFVVGSGSMFGMGVRWSDSKVDLGSDGDLDLEGFQIALTFSQLY